MKNEFLRVPYGQTVHGEDEIQAVLKVLRTSTQMGEHVRRFEQGVAALFNKRHGVMVNSGTSALFLAAEISGLPAGSEVITPVLTFATTVSALIKNNLVPVFIDAEEGAYLINHDLIERSIGPQTRAICVPNLIGNVADWRLLRELAEKHRLCLIEDSADTLGATLNERPSGSFADLCITSFYGSHIINCAGNGGMLCLDDEGWLRQALLLRSWGRTSSLFTEAENIENRFNIELDGIPYDAKFVFERAGYNMEPSELGAAFGLVQLAKLESNIAARIANFNVLRDFFSGYEDWFILPRQTPGSRTGWLAFPLTVRSGAPFTRRDLQIFLEGRNIQTRVIFTGNILRQPGFKNIHCRKAEGGYPIADAVTRGGMLLACHHGMNAAMLNHIRQSFQEFAAGF